MGSSQTVLPSYSPGTQWSTGNTAHLCSRNGWLLPRTASCLCSLPRLHGQFQLTSSPSSCLIQFAGDIFPPRVMFHCCSKTSSWSVRCKAPPLQTAPISVNRWTEIPLVWRWEGKERGETFYSQEFPDYQESH